MVELTDEQAKDLFYSLELAEHWSEEDSSFEFIKETVSKFLIDNITKEQIKQLAEQHNASVIEWVEFDYDDELTWPNNYSHVVAVSDKETSIATMFEISEGEPFFNKCALVNIVKWAYLPSQNDKL